MTSMYPMPRLRPAADNRFGEGLVNEVAVVLELRGFPPVRTGSDRARLRRFLAAFLYDSGSEPVGSPDAAASRGLPPAGSLPTGVGEGPGNPEPQSWMDPNHELTHYDTLGIAEAQLIDMPGVSSGWYSYTALARRTQ